VQGVQGKGQVMSDSEKELKGVFERFCRWGWSMPILILLVAAMYALYFWAIGWIGGQA